MASAAGKRIAQSAVDWARFTKVCPKYQIEMLRAIKTKHDTYLNKVHQLPESLPKIDFATYKARLPNPTMADRFQKSIWKIRNQSKLKMLRQIQSAMDTYEALSIPYPVDKENMMQKVESERQTMDKNVQQYIKETEQEIKDSKTFLTKLDSLPKYEEMTEEMMNYYFPETAEDPDRPTIWPHKPEEQPYNPDYKYIN